MADTDKTAPSTWGQATRMLQKGESNVTNADIFGGSDDPTADPLAPKKKSKGDGLDYLGHFAGDDVASEGHNTGSPRGKDGGGKPQIRRFHDGDIAKTGFRKIPGNATTGYTEKKTRAILNDASNGLGRIVATGPIDKAAGMPLRKRDHTAKMRAKPAVGESSVLRHKRR